LPVRKDLLINIENFTQKQLDLFKILVLGGSRGAKFLNQMIPSALACMDNLQIIHQTGEQDLIATKDLYLQLNPNHTHQIISFIDDMSKAYQAANLVICRGGASTVFEILASGSASILIPLPGAIDDHQTKNALYLLKHNATILINQDELTLDKLKNLIIEFKNNPNKINSLREAAKSLYNQYEEHDIANNISKIIINLA
jgi:UDP-N-acetylglucosamine--N-acetylmuramyl-(pentapeptide) pyrophosphoryl-undecaprenol N-acetylglucosamine transferase